MTTSFPSADVGTDTPPALPGQWQFIQELQQPRHRRHGLNSHRPPGPGEIDLRQGLAYRGGYPDREGLLVTAEDDLRDALEASDLLKPAGIAVTTRHIPDMADEAFRLTLEIDAISLEASGIEGIRRGLYHLENMLAGMDGPALRVGVVERLPKVKNRISRCFFGPIKRPPLNHDELMDEVDYYPPAYLSRLASEGVNGLWLTIAFRDICQTSLTTPSPAMPRRLEKLRQTVARCRRYGIRIWVFCIEPRAMAVDDPLLVSHPELGGAKVHDKHCFCPRTETARRYLHESTHWLFSQVPHLGGLINISYGERTTTCLSSVYAHSDQRVQCPRCSDSPNWQVLHESLSAMQAGMRDANPQAQMISWMYMPTPGPSASWVFDCASHTPAGVILQCNFESNLVAGQLGQPRVGGDYWLSQVGPSGDFARIADLAAGAGTPTSAKLQVTTSHEVATVPMVPVPSLVFRKFQAMAHLGCEHAMLCWYFGNYPGVMNRAAGEASFDLCDGDEEAFLLRLARRDWGESAPCVVAAWRQLAQAYGEYPLANMFQYYGPMHDGPVWELQLEPALNPLSRSWKLFDRANGDIMGECLGQFTLAEAMVLCDRLADGWKQGWQMLEPLKKQAQGRPDCLQQMRIIETLAIQFDSGRNILRFHHLRHQLSESKGRERSALLGRMRDIVRQEISNSLALITLCEAEPSLGYHSEAEGYKYDPPRLRARASQLERLLGDAFPVVDAWPADESWPAPVRRRYICRSGGGWTSMGAVRWRVENDRDGLEFYAICDAADLRVSVIYLWLLDRMGVWGPQIIRCDPDLVMAPSNWAEIHMEKVEAGQWMAKVSLPALSWQLRPSLQPAYISVSHSFVTQDGQADRHVWPPEARLAEGRLGLHCFDPTQAASLVLSTPRATHAT